MRCYICNREDNKISWDSRHEDYGPCFTCQAVINEITYEQDDTDTEGPEDETEVLDVGC